MTKIHIPVGLIVVLLLAACDDDGRAYREAALREQQKDQIPSLITTHGDLQVWKIKDMTPGGSNYVYYTTRGDTFSDQGKGRQQHVLPPQ